MRLPNTKHLISSVRLTVFCLKENDKILLDKLLSALNDDGNACASVINLDEKAATNTVVAMNKSKFAPYSLCVNDLISFAEQNNEHLIATFSVDTYSNWRHVHFRVAEEFKDKVCFVRFVTSEDAADIHLQIESGENAWQYIPYRLDGDKLNEI